MVRRRASLPAQPAAPGRECPVHRRAHEDGCRSRHTDAQTPSSGLPAHSHHRTENAGGVATPGQASVFILKTGSLFRSIVRVPRTRAARPGSDAQRSRVAQAAVGQSRNAARAVGTEDAFAHVRDLATIDVDRDLERGAAVLAQELARVVDDAVREVDRVEAALICANLSSLFKPVTPDTLTVPEDLIVNASSPTLVQRKFCRLPPL